MRIVKIEPLEYGGRIKKTATSVGVKIIEDNLVDNLLTLVTVFSDSEEENVSSEVIEAFNETLSGKEYQSLDTVSGIDINEEIIRAIFKKTGLVKKKEEKTSKEEKKK